jgi:murein DD-endopeptidase MepM/ murein hydrolase activator NlpD
MILKTALITLPIILALKANIDRDELILPVGKGYISSDYGMRLHPITKEHKFHRGIDIVPEDSRDAFSIGAGIVIFSGSHGGYGKLLVVKHSDGFTTHYAHLESINYRVGEIVSKGSVIGQIGSSGNSSGVHLHFEIRKSGKPIDPSKIFSSLNNSNKR